MGFYYDARMQLCLLQVITGIWGHCLRGLKDCRKHLCIFKILGVGGISLLVECFIWKQKDLDLILGSHVKSQVWQCSFIMPTLKKQRQENPGAHLLASLVNSRFSERSCFKK